MFNQRVMKRSRGRPGTEASRMDIRYADVTTALRVLDLVDIRHSIWDRLSIYSSRVGV